MKRVNSYLQEIKETIRGGLVYIFSGSVLSRGIAMISSIAIARIVDKTAYAHYGYATNLYQYVEVVAGLGVASAVLKYCTDNKGGYQKNHAYLQFGVKVGCIVQFACSLLLCIMVKYAEIPFPGAKRYIYLLVLMPTLSLLLNIFQSYLRVLRQNRQYASVGVLQAMLVCILGIGFTLFFGVCGMVFARYISIVITVLFCLHSIKKCDAVAECILLTSAEKRSFLGLGISLVISSIFSTLMPINETFLVSQLIQDEIVSANFKVAGLFPEQLLVIPSAVVVYYFPVFSQIKEANVLWKKAVTVGILNFFIVVAAALAGMLLTPAAIRILYGSRYVDAIPMTYMLWIMRAVNGSIRMIPMNILPAVGHSRFNAVLAVITCIAQTAADYYMLIYYGIQGIAYAAILAYLISGFTFWAYLYHVCRTGQIK